MSALYSHFPKKKQEALIICDQWDHKIEIMQVTILVRSKGQQDEKSRVIERNPVSEDIKSEKLS